MILIVSLVHGKLLNVWFVVICVFISFSIINTSLWFFLSGENCTVKNVSDGVINRHVVLTCPMPLSTQDAKFCCYDSLENVECCNAVDRVHNM